MHDDTYACASIQLEMHFTRLKIVIAINLVSRYPLYRALFMRETIHFSLHVSLDGKKRSTTRDACFSSFIIPATYIKLTKVYKISGTLMPSFTLTKSFFILFIELLFVICLQYFNFKVEQNTKLLDNITFIHPVVILDIVAI